jgi:GNAT superfamily N-acetyltransferase
MTAREIVYAPLDADREEEAEKLVLSVFDALVAPCFTEQGRKTFHDFVSQFAFSRRPRKRLTLAALRQGEIVGIIEVLEGSHVALLFVSVELQGQGIGKTLVQKAVQQCRRDNRGLSALTVNSSINAVKAYESMGFSPTSGEQEKDGIRFVPMTLMLS